MKNILHILPILLLLSCSSEKLSPAVDTGNTTTVASATPETIAAAQSVGAALVATFPSDSFNSSLSSSIAKHIAKNLTKSATTACDNFPNEGPIVMKTVGTAGSYGTSSNTLCVDTAGCEFASCDNSGDIAFWKINTSLPVSVSCNDGTDDSTVSLFGSGILRDDGTTEQIRGSFTISLTTSGTTSTATGITCSIDVTAAGASGGCEDADGNALTLSDSISCENPTVDYASFFNGTSCTDPVGRTNLQDGETVSYQWGLDALSAQSDPAAGADCFAGVAVQNDESGCISKTSLTEACAVDGDCNAFCGSQTVPAASCSTSADCSFDFSGPMLDNNWDDSGGYLDTCVISSTVSSNQLAMLMSTDNGSTCQGGAGYMRATSFTNGIVTLTINSWQNMSHFDNDDQRDQVGIDIGTTIANSSGGFDNVDTASLRLEAFNSGTVFRTVNFQDVATSGNSGLAETATGPVTLKLVKTGGSVEGFYKVGSGSFISLGTKILSGGPTLNLLISINAADGSGNFGATVSDFVVEIP